jgi:biotin-(acetyl-CoA carboxylase) ligase
VLCRPLTEPAIEVLSLRVALGVARVVEQHARHVGIEIKWPNDLMLGGRKLGGILCEAHWQGDTAAWVAVGVGINLQNPIPPDLGAQAVALAEYSPEVTPDSLCGGCAVLAATRSITSLPPRWRVRERDWLKGRAITAPSWVWLTVT